MKVTSGLSICPKGLESEEVEAYQIGLHIDDWRRGAASDLHIDKVSALPRKCSDN